MQPSPQAPSTLPSPANDISPQSPQDMRRERMLQAGLQLMPIRICKLSGEENAFVRTGFNVKVRRAFMQRLAALASRETETLFGDQPDSVRDRIRKKRARALISYDKHHAIPVSLCPVELSPHNDWDKTLQWWRQEAHRRIHAVPPIFHEEIHAFVNTQIQQLFGNKALGSSPSQTYEGEILLPYKPASVWLPPVDLTDFQSVAPMLPRAPNRKSPRQSATTLTFKDDLLARQRARERRMLLSRALP